jgi:hypothetical protein
MSADSNTSGIFFLLLSLDVTFVNNFHKCTVQCSKLEFSIFSVIASELSTRVMFDQPTDGTRHGNFPIMAAYKGVCGWQLYTQHGTNTAHT